MSIHFSNDLGALEGRPTTRVVAARRSGFYRNHGKRLLEVFLVLATSFVTVPLVAILALLVSMDGGSPFFRQKRVGRNGVVFTILKIRTMVPDADQRFSEYLAINPAARAEWAHTQKLKTDPRVTRLGRYLRMTSLDELPQLWNVFLGHMSLVGPRPILIDQQSIYPGTAYFSVRPGITGLWQISDRNQCTFAERAQFDAHYESSLSVAGDFFILLRTIRAVTRCTGY